MGEPEIVHGAIPPGASILELGAGAGRMTRPLVTLGHPVVAVDESGEMLARIRGAAGHRDADGLAVDAYLTGDGSWVRAVPASRGEALGRSPR
jgi:ubiquinone/menaquinone biosynthesis C-methylase UbiE